MSRPVPFLTNGNRAGCALSDTLLLYELLLTNNIRLPGPPLTRDSAISLLLSHNVTVGIGIEEPWSARNTRFDVAWVSTVQLAYYEIY